MMRTKQQEQLVERQFDHFCRTVLANKNRDLIRQRKRLQHHEPSLCVLPSSAEPFACDVYFTEEAWISLGDYSILVCNTSLADALLRIAPSLCRIIVLSYYLSLSDRQIAEALDMKRSTVQYQRSKALSQLHSLLCTYHDSREG